MHVTKSNARWLAIVLLSAATAACNIETISSHSVIDTDDAAGAADDTDQLACEAVEEAFAAGLPHSSLTASGDYDALSFTDWCLQNLVADDREQRIGNANAWSANEDDAAILATSPFKRARRATLAQGAQLDIYALEPQGSLPFVRKIHFADWEGPGGRCALEMRVYQRDLGASGKKPLLYFHGGGWRNRSTTYTAAEVLVTHLTDSHIVFMPAYPLHGAKDGPDECREASFQDILAVAQEAFDWVAENKDVFGASGAERIDVMGHSAGGQLAAYVAQRNLATSGKLLNFYGPVEFADFIDNAGTRYADSFAESKALLASLLGIAALTDLQRPYPEQVSDNSMSETITTQGAGAVPPFFMVQGNADATVPVEQALLACNAVGGSATASGGRYRCGDIGQVAIIDGGGHNLDRRCLGNDSALTDLVDPEFFETVCPTHEADYAVVRDVLDDAFAWLAE